MRNLKCLSNFLRIFLNPVTLVWVNSNVMNNMLRKSLPIRSSNVRLTLRHLSLLHDQQSKRMLIQIPFFLFVLSHSIMPLVLILRMNGMLYVRVKVFEFFLAGIIDFEEFLIHLLQFLSQKFLEFDIDGRSTTCIICTRYTILDPISHRS